jgi:hypothetical protein
MDGYNRHKPVIAHFAKSRHMWITKGLYDMAKYRDGLALFEINVLQIADRLHAVN